MRLVVALLVILAFVGAGGCKNAPGNTGQYATHDHGNDNRP